MREGWEEGDMVDHEGGGWHGGPYGRGKGGG